jgi:hypothetical protein
MKTIEQILENLQDGIIESKETDPIYHPNFYGYIKIENKEVVAIGEERVRDGGWLWFRDSSNTGTFESALRHISDWPNLVELAKRINKRD